jgi:hypothetical protein
MDESRTSVDLLRARVERIAEQVSRSFQESLSAENPFFINDVVTALENAVGDVVHVAQDAVDQALNATRDVVNTIEHIGERAVEVTENLLNDATLQTEAFLNVAHAVIDLEATMDWSKIAAVEVGGGIRSGSSRKGSKFSRGSIA